MFQNIVKKIKDKFNQEYLQLHILKINTMMLIAIFISLLLGTIPLLMQNKIIGYTLSIIGVLSYLFFIGKAIEVNFYFFYSTILKEMKKPIQQLLIEKSINHHEQIVNTQEFFSEKINKE